VTEPLSPVDVSVCVTCQGHGGERPGVAMHHALQALADPQAMRVHAVECFAVCKRPCMVAVSSPGKWTYLIGDLDVASDVGALLEYARAYAASASGTPTLGERPKAIRKGTIARIPPQPA
jgi:predicted metal-binding protein